MSVVLFCRKELLTILFELPYFLNSGSTLLVGKKLRVLLNTHHMKATIASN